jgi:hypothetical protein
MVSEFLSNFFSLALAVQVFCLINRPDVAMGAIEGLNAWGSDNVFAQMIDSWVGIARSEPAKFEEAFYLFEELTATHLTSAKMYCSKAVCLMQARRFEEAEPLLLEGLNKVIAYHPKDRIQTTLKQLQILLL